MMRDELNLLVIAREIPYPPNHGGRVETWNRLVALVHAGVKIQLITWADRGVTENHITKLHEIVESALIFSRHRWPIFLLHPHDPSGVISRCLFPWEYRNVKKRMTRHKPDLIFIDGLEGYKLGLTLASDLKIPVVYRSHNVEYQYFANLDKTETSIVRKALFWLNKSKIFRCEKFVRERCDIVYDISKEDTAHWERINTTAPKPKILPTYLFFESGITEMAENRQKDIDVLYVGNLFTPNNLFGLGWFVREVVPYLEGLRITIAGSNPRETIIELARANKIQIVTNPPDIKLLYKRASILINPVWHGSGVNIKMIEMLATGKPVVSTAQGTHGLAPELRSFAILADSPQEFAQAIKNNIARALSVEQSNMVQQIHDSTQVGSLIAELKSLTERF